MKDEVGSYFVAPTSDSLNCFSSENTVPLEWFLLFSEEGRKNFYTHWGFNSIHYNSTLEQSKSRLASSLEKIEKTLSAESPNPLEFFLRNLARSLEDLRKWLVQFDSQSYLVLNYGDICNYIHPYTLKNENSVTEVNKILELVSLSNFAEAELALRLFFQKWDDISTKCAGGTEESRIQ